MAGVRGVKNPMPKKGDKPTGIFSTRGSQKMDPCTAPGKATMTYANNAGDKVAPVARNNMLKG